MRGIFGTTEWETKIVYNPKWNETCVRANKTETKAHAYIFFTHIISTYSYMSRVFLPAPYEILHSLYAHMNVQKIIEWWSNAIILLLNTNSRKYFEIDNIYTEHLMLHESDNRPIWFRTWIFSKYKTAYDIFWT